MEDNKNNEIIDDDIQKLMKALFDDPQDKTGSDTGISVEEKKKAVFNKEYIDKTIEEVECLVLDESIKKFLKEYASVLCYKEARIAQGLPVPPTSARFVFTGDPGTGKTFVARYLAKILYGAGIISEPAIYETSRADFVAGYVGQTAMKTKEVLAASKDKLLIIDDFNNLFPKNDGAYDFGVEAVDCLVNELKSYPEEHPVILAGYTELVTEALKRNPMMDVLFNTRIEFPCLDADQLTKIFVIFCKDNQFNVSEAAVSKANRYFENVLQKDKFSGYARCARNLVETAIQKSIARNTSNNKIEDFAVCPTIEEEDIAE